MSAIPFEHLTHEQQLPLLLELAHSALPLFHIALPADVHLVNLSENATYKVTAADDVTFALRIHRDGYHDRAAIASELAWLQDLRNQSVVVTPRPLAGRDGALIQVAQHHSMARPRHVVLFEWEQGREPGIGEDLHPSFEALGATAARMHLHAMRWQRPRDFVRHTWNFETALGEHNPHWGRWRHGIGVTPAMQALFARTVARIGERLSAYGQSAARFGLVHGDMRLANLLIDGDEVKVIDFDDCGFSWFMYDAATTISFYEHQPHVGGLLESWKKGYRLVRELPHEDEAEIPTFVMLRRLLLVAWIGTRRDTDLAKSMGISYSEGTVGLCEAYLSGRS